MNQRDVLNSVRKSQQDLRDLDANYKLGLYSDIWYNEHVKALKDTIEAKKALFNRIYNIHQNI